MRLFIAYQVATNVLAVIIANSYGEAYSQLANEEDDENPTNYWQVEDYGDIVQASQQPTYFDLEQILLKGW